MTHTVIPCRRERQSNLACRATAAAFVLAVSSCGGSSSTGPTAPPGPAGTFYVAPSGSDSAAGTLAAPWRTVRYALGQLHPGNTLYLRRGTYTGAENTIDSQSGPVPSGTSWSNAITIAGYPGEAVTLQPPDGLSAMRLTVNAPSYLIFQDFTIDMVNHSPGVTDAIFSDNGSNHDRFLRLEVMNHQGTAFGFGNDATFHEVLNCRVHDNGRAPGINSGYGGYISGNDNLFDGNDFYNNSGYGLHVYGTNNTPRSAVSRNIIRNNKIHDNGTHGGTNYGLVVAWGSDNVVNDNMIYGNRGGVLVYTNSSNTQVYNNSIYNNRPLEGILIQYATGAIIRDNTLNGNGAGIVDLGTGTTLSNNSVR